MQDLQRPVSCGLDPNEMILLEVRLLSLCVAVTIGQNGQGPAGVALKMGFQ